MDPPAAKAAAVVAQPPPLPSPGKPGKPTTLLDVYEVEWITRELERLLVRDTTGCAVAGAEYHRRKRAKVSPEPKPSPSKTKKGGFLAELLGRHAVSICGDSTVATGAGAGGELSGRAWRGRCGSFREVKKV